MSDPVTRLAEAEAKAAAARARLSVTMSALQDRLEPRRLAQEARRGLADAGNVAAEQARDAVRQRPGALAGVVAVAGLFLARHRIAGLFHKRKATVPGDAS